MNSIKGMICRAAKPVRLAALLGALILVSVAVNALIIIADGKSAPAVSDHNGDYGVSAVGAAQLAHNDEPAVLRVTPATTQNAAPFPFLLRVGACNARRPLCQHRAACA